MSVTAHGASMGVESQGGGACVWGNVGWEGVWKGSVVGVWCGGGRGECGRWDNGEYGTGRQVEVALGRGEVWEVQSHWDRGVCHVMCVWAVPGGRWGAGVYMGW